MKKIGIIDYGVGNIRSISNALINLGADTLLTSSRDEILNCDDVVTIHFLILGDEYSTPVHYF